MIDQALLRSFVGFVFVASITPGPNNLMVFASGAAFGWRRSLPHVYGIALGAVSMVVAVTLGLGVVFDQAPMVASLLRSFGAAWMVWLAWQLFRSGLIPSTASSQDSVGPGGNAQPLTWFQAACFQLLNPKTWSIMIATSGAYVELAPTPITRAFMMALVFAIIAPLCNGVWLFSGRALHRIFNRPHTRKVALFSMAALVLLSAFLVAM